MRSRFLFTVAALLATVALVAGCARIRLVGDSVSEDAKTGAGIGFTIVRPSRPPAPAQPSVPISNENPFGDI